MSTKKLVSIIKRYRTQIFVAIIYHIINLSHGIAIGWLSPIVEIIQSPNTPLNFPVTIEQVSWIGSMFGFGLLSGTIIFGLTLSYLSCKINMYLLAVPTMLFWILTYFAQSVEYLYAGRLFVGATSAGVCIVGNFFLSEILHKDIRGTFISMGMMFLSCGSLVGFILPTKLDYYLIPCIVLVLPIIYLICFCFFPETPQSLLKKGRLDEAEAAYSFYNDSYNKSKAPSSSNFSGNKTETKEISEFEELKSAILNSNSNVSITVSDFFKKSALKAFTDAFVLWMLYQFSGSLAFLNYMTSILAASGSTMDPYLGTIIMGIAHILGTFSAAALVDYLGRRILIFAGIIPMIVGMIAFGAFVQFTESKTGDYYEWVPLVFLWLVVFTSAYGIFGNIFTIILEILPAKIRPQASSITIAIASGQAMVALKLYPISLSDLGLPATMYYTAAISLITGIYLYIFLPETKGKSMNK